MVVHKYGHRVLLQLIAPSSLPPHVAGLLQPKSTPVVPTPQPVEAASDADEVSSPYGKQAFAWYR